MITLTELVAILSFLILFASFIIDLHNKKK